MYKRWSEISAETIQNFSNDWNTNVIPRIRAWTLNPTLLPAFPFYGENYQLHKREIKQSSIRNVQIHNRWCKLILHTCTVWIIMYLFISRIDARKQKYNKMRYKNHFMWLLRILHAYQNVPGLWTDAMCKLIKRNHRHKFSTTLIFLFLQKLL